MLPNVQRSLLKRMLFVPVGRESLRDCSYVNIMATISSDIQGHKASSAKLTNSGSGNALSDVSVGSVDSVSTTGLCRTPDRRADCWLDCDCCAFCLPMEISSQVMEPLGCV